MILNTRSAAVSELLRKLNEDDRLTIQRHYEGQDGQGKLRTGQRGIVY